MNDGENIRREIRDGDRVKTVINAPKFRMGHAFAKNRADQWLVVWIDGTTSIVHQNNLEREP